eukprot:CAMPEP_0182533400 /NCGR_PEP_ID=MMETSP1323-20130603/13663_1 /TAXON_ID=236787 /ORGANISM="Florenciella parvula, Strain RCC1693" /LENGTH=63 /DNA_ID=CAMNT_0024743277 /DNA_START=1 /DNA_END=192 /DNA_ORIENTATION=-
MDYGGMHSHHMGQPYHEVQQQPMAPQHQGSYQQYHPQYHQHPQHQQLQHPQHQQGSMLPPVYH